MTKIIKRKRVGILVFNSNNNINTFELLGIELNKPSGRSEKIKMKLKIKRRRILQ